MSTNKQKYFDLVEELAAIEKVNFDKKGRQLYLTDVCVDRENCAGIDESNEQEFYAAMHEAAISAAACRAEEYGLDINELMGRCVW